jgi:hypothetical protein
VLGFDFVPPLSLLGVAGVVCSDHGEVTRHHVVQATAVGAHLAGVNNAGARSRRCTTGAVVVSGVPRSRCAVYICRLRPPPPVGPAAPRFFMFAPDLKRSLAEPLCGIIANIEILIY